MLHSQCLAQGWPWVLGPWLSLPWARRVRAREHMCTRLGDDFPPCVPGVGFLSPP